MAVAIVIGRRVNIEGEKATRGMHNKPRAERNEWDEWPDKGEYVESLRELWYA